MIFNDRCTAPGPRRARIFPARKWIEIPTQEVELGTGERLRVSFRAKSPRCTVPALTLDDVLCL